jgi:hypothetical protein
MIVDLSNEIQSAVRSSILAANTGITQLYDYTPSGVKMPYVTFGEIAKLQNHTKDVRFHVYDVVLHVWTSGPGRVQCQDIMGKITNSLDNTKLTLDNGEPSVYFVNSTVIKDPDGTTQHGVLRFEVRE